MCIKWSLGACTVSRRHPHSKHNKNNKNNSGKNNENNNWIEQTILENEYIYIHYHYILYMHIYTHQPQQGAQEEMSNLHFCRCFWCFCYKDVWMLSMKMLFMKYGWAHSIRDALRRRRSDRVSFEAVTSVDLIDVNVWPAPELEWICKPSCRLGSIFAVEKSLPDFCSDFYCWFFLHFLWRNSRTNRKEKQNENRNRNWNNNQRICRMVCKFIPCVLACALWFYDFFTTK